MTTTETPKITKTLGLSTDEAFILRTLVRSEGAIVSRTIVHNRPVDPYLQELSNLDAKLSKLVGRR